MIKNAIKIKAKVKIEPFYNYNIDQRCFYKNRFIYTLAKTWTQEFLIKDLKKKEYKLQILEFHKPNNFSNNKKTFKKSCK